MGSEFSPSVRACLPLCALVLETAFVLIFCFFTSYNDSANNQTLTQNSQVFQDITIMAALGLGFLTSSFPKNSWSSVAFNLFILAIGVQWAVLLDGFLNKFSSGKIVIELSSIQLATMSAMSVLISVGAVLGKTNLLQLMMMALVEVTAFSVMMMVSDRVFNVDNHTSMMHIHVFAAYFGLAVAWCLSSSQPKEKQREVKTAKGPDLFAMLGTLFLWIFWPNFNSALLSIENKRKAVFNTYYALAVSSVTATSVSAAAHPEGKISMTHIHSAVLAGGVAVGASCHLISSPWPAMLVGLLAGLISVGGAKCLPVGFHRMLMVHYAFGLPGLLGEITYITLMALQASQNQDTTNCYQIFLNMGILSFVMIMSLASGFLTGSILRLQIWKAPGVNKYYYDQDFWKFPHLADEF
ncbi:RH-like protein isoform X1 [Trichechus manatus latirostris]|uniref:RH-like protein isoform X1 n=1 Tax=Trichechus manatus latirostris TaxID=127582 RepID=A0A2Y9R8E9_TRIMA|nr:RH-like protein isoform X1 [Trichechus manatus latirostris]